MLMPSPLMRYQQAIQDKKYHPNAAQYQAVLALERIYQQLIEYQSNKKKENRLSIGLKKILGKERNLIRGLYLWGGVGGGKTTLMDLFFQSLPSERKLRLHFNRFLLQIHTSLARLQGEQDPLERLADDLYNQTDILCFDEFSVNDITDAMLLGTLFKALFSRGVILVATSNIPPNHLYRNGLQRTRFLPAITLIEYYCEVLHLDSGEDYRLRTLPTEHLYLFPISQTTEKQMNSLFKQLAGGEGMGAQTLQVNHHMLPVRNLMGEVIAVEFSVLCEEARSAMDYIVLSQRYHTVLLHNVPILNEKKEDPARRFIILIDEFYERKVKLIISSVTSMNTLYQGKQLHFEFVRCLSRLQEMQSIAYWEQPHLP